MRCSAPTAGLQQLDLADTADLPPPFVERVRKQLASARIPPVKTTPARRVDERKRLVCTSPLPLHLGRSPGALLTWQRRWP